MRQETKQQLRRLSALAYFPSDPVALEELGRAAETAGTPAAQDAIGEWLNTQSRCPSPAELRAAVLAARDRSAAPKDKCAGCDGNGWVTVYRLVTYWDNTFRVRRSESLDHMSFEQVEAAKVTLGRNQTILGAAKPCPACRRTEAA